MYHLVRFVDIMLFIIGNLIGGKFGAYINGKIDQA